MQENKTELKRSLGLIDATSLVSMIGSEFLSWRRDIGSAAWLLVIWLETITVAAALSYGELRNDAGNLVGIHCAYGRLVSFCTDGRFYSLQTGVVAYCSNLANYSAIFSWFR
jgi:APA family basic amino acid/polyamine antiporter